MSPSVKLRDHFYGFIGHQELSTLITNRSNKAFQRKCLRKKEQPEVREKEGRRWAGRQVLRVQGEDPQVTSNPQARERVLVSHLWSLSYLGLGS